MPIYILITKADGKQIVNSTEGQDQKQISDMCQALYPGSSWRTINEADHLAFLEAHRITV